MISSMILIIVMVSAELSDLMARAAVLVYQKPSSMDLQRHMSHKIDGVYSTYVRKYLIRKSEDSTDREAIVFEQYRLPLVNQNDIEIEKLSKPWGSGLADLAAIYSYPPFLRRNIRQRHKRYTSYLTMCHFKICNMGKKRSGGYFPVINSMDKK